MKKLISVILSLVMLFSLAFPVLADESVVGVWYLQYAMYGDKLLNASALGMTMTITLNEDGTATGYSAYNQQAESATGTWTQNGSTVTINFTGDPAQEAVLENDTLFITDESSGIILVCTRDEVVITELETYIPAPAVTDATIENYIGSWECILAEYAGQQLQTAALNLAMLLVISDTEIIYYANNNGEEVAASFEAQVLDGALNAIQDGMSLWALQLQEDGYAALSLSGITYYFFPIPVEELTETP